MTIKGTPGNDKLKGTSHADVFDLSQGGNDVANGSAGNDTFIFKTAFTAADQIDGGTGNDIVELDGNYSGSHAVTFGAKTMVGVEKIAVAAGHNYKLITNSATVANHATLAVDASKLGANNALTFNGSHETNGHFNITGGAGVDMLTGGAQSDTLNLTKGGEDHASGGSGNDRFNVGDLDSPELALNGGVGNDVMGIDTIATKSIALYGSFYASIEKLVITGAGCTLNEQDDMVGAGKTLTVDGHALKADAALVFTPNDVDSIFHITGGAGDDELTGGQLNDVLIGGKGDDFLLDRQTGDDTFDLTAGGKDEVLGGEGADLIKADKNAADTFAYLFADQSTSTTHDKITGVNFAHDIFALGTVQGVDHAVSGSISNSHFDENLAAIIGSGPGGHMGTGHAIIVAASGGGDSGNAYLVVDENGNAAYDAGTDYVIDITGHIGKMTVDNFTTAG